MQCELTEAPPRPRQRRMRYLGKRENCKTEPGAPANSLFSRERERNNKLSKTSIKKIRPVEGHHYPNARIDLDFTECTVYHVTSLL
ncbi:hypothetical protein NPIL_399341 [Nephila pilipes]|uniref:Uncharacterized protein n=1 Tax=Nephila pilipes TaxID=299642 RepID=A0A8X6MYL8_NEPPI|nr:hypothetical protein NPIL_399341 [Nephila pilipes]